MLSLSLQRFRYESLAIVTALAAIAVVALITGSMMHDEYQSSGLADCLAAGEGSRCRDLIARFDNRFDALQLLIVPLILLPALLGAFIGAPLVAREIETGSHRFLWTQGVTRTRWFTSVTATALLVATVAAAAYSAISAAWLVTPNAVTDEQLGNLYDLQGVLPIAAAVFAVAIGIASGVLLRRTLPAMATTIAVFIAVRLAIASQLRPHFARPETIEYPFGQPNPLTGSGAWILSQQTLSASGRELGTGGSLDLANVGDLCPALDVGPGRALPDPALVDDCLTSIGVHQLVRYHPGERFWTFQLLEGAMLLGLTAGAIAIAAWAITHRDT